jgi:glycosyltransferase involved in cell wall biosynthesis
VDLEEFHPTACASTDSKSHCVFVGALDYHANIDGLLWFCERIWPIVHARIPDSLFSIVGRRPSAKILNLAKQPGVELVGEVDDVIGYYARAEITVVPLRIARGIQNKVLEAMAMGKAVVASPQALEGLQLTDRVHVRQATTPETWVETICQLLLNPEMANHLGRAAREYVEEHHCWETCLRPFKDLLVPQQGTSESVEQFALGQELK